MRLNFTSKSSAIYSALFLSLVAFSLFSREASGREGVVSAPGTTDTIFTKNVKNDGISLIQIKSQPHLEEHLDRINKLRLLLKGPLTAKDSPPINLAASKPLTGVKSHIIPRNEPIVDGATTKVAILELEMSISSKRGPSTFYPGAGLVLALHQIAIWSEKNMINALNAGGRPIYSDVGHLIGVEDPNTGRLIGGRKG